MRGVELNFFLLVDGVRGEIKSENYQGINNGNFFELLINFLFSLMDENREANLEKYNSFMIIPEKNESNLNLAEIGKEKDLFKSAEDAEKAPIFFAFLLIGKEILNGFISQGNGEFLNLKKFENKFGFYLSQFFKKSEVKGEFTGISNIFENIARKEGYSYEAQKFIKTFFEQVEKLLFFSKVQPNNPAISNFSDKGNFYKQDNKVHLILMGKEEFLNTSKVPFERPLQYDPIQTVTERVDKILERADKILEEAFIEIKKAFEELPSSVKEEIKKFFERKVHNFGEELRIKTVVEGKEGENLYIPKENFKEAYLKLKEFDLETLQRKSQENLYIIQESPLKGIQIAKSEKGQIELPHAFTKMGIERMPEFIKNLVIETSPSGEKKAFVQLEPPELGKMELDLKVHDGEVEIQIKVERHEAFHHLREELSQLKQHIEDLGLRVRDFHVSLGLTTSEGKHFAEGERRKSFKGSNKDLSLDEVNQESKEASPYHGGILYRIV